MVEQTIPSRSTLLLESTYEFKHEQRVELYQKENIDTLEWPDGENGTYAKKFLLPIIKNGIGTYIDNIKIEVNVLKHQNLVIPITIVNENYGISHVCSPYDHYISHAIESLHFIRNRFLSYCAKTCTLGLGWLLRMGKLNKVVNVNNWLFATDLYPIELSEQSLEAIISYLKKNFPDHAIVFRSLNPSTNAKVLEYLKRNQLHLLVSRQIYLSNGKNEDIFKTRIFKSDLKLLKSSAYEILDEQQLSSEDYPQIIHLYKQLYISKYSNSSPDLTVNFLELMIKEKLLNLKVLKKNNSIDGVVGYFSRNGIMTSPFFGYEQSKSKHSELYRLLSTILLLEAKDKGMILHQGAGASFYKTIRRAEGNLEYMAVYEKHLPLRNQVAWRLLKGIMNRIAIKLMKKY